MGKLLFVNTNRINGIFAIVICLAMIAGGIWLTLDRNYVAIVFVPLGILGIKFFLKTATQRAEIYEQGFISKSIYGEVRGRYADLKSIARSAGRVNGVLNTNIFLTTNSGEKILISNEKFLKKDDKMQLFVEQVSLAMAQTWAKNLERQTEVVWLMNGSKPLIKIRKEGVLLEDRPGVETFIPFGQFQMKPGYGLGVEILNGTQKVMTTNSGVPNFIVGVALISLLTNQRSLSATTSN